VVSEWKDIPKNIQKKIQSSLDIIESRDKVDVNDRSDALDYLFQQHGVYLGGRYSGNRAARTCGICVSNVKIGFQNIISKWQTSNQ